MAAASLPRIALTLGDPAGIGPEIVLKAALDPRVRAACVPILVGDAEALRAHAASFAPGVHVQRFDSVAAAHAVAGGAVVVVHLPSLGADFRIGQIAPANGQAAVQAIATAVDAAVRGEVDAVAAAPIHETAIAQAGIAFDGHASFVARRTGTPLDDVFLMLCRETTRIVHTTLHASVRRAIEQITPQRVLAVLRATDRALRRLGIERPRIGVSGLNPHAGENRLFGDEEADIIAPAIASARLEGIDATGPQGADTLLAQPGFDACVVMLHDQGHIAMKVAAPNQVVGMVIGTPLAFASVGHGTAMDIAGRGAADPVAMVSAVLALAQARHETTDPTPSQETSS